MEVGYNIPTESPRVLCTGMADKNEYPGLLRYTQGAAPGVDSPAPLGGA
jgi:hypothetical protein